MYNNNIARQTSRDCSSYRYIFWTCSSSTGRGGGRQCQPSLALPSWRRLRLRRRRFLSEERWAGIPHSCPVHVASCRPHQIVLQYPRPRQYFSCSNIIVFLSLTLPPCFPAAYSTQTPFPHPRTPDHCYHYHYRYPVPPPPTVSRPWGWWLHRPRSRLRFRWRGVGVLRVVIGIGIGIGVTRQERMR